MKLRKEKKKKKKKTIFDLDFLISMNRYGFKILLRTYSVVNLIGDIRTIERNADVL